jgi:hypothetical protein
LQDVFAGVVGRMGFPGENDLDGLPAIGQQPLDARQVVQDQVGALIGSGFLDCSSQDQ